MVLKLADALSRPLHHHFSPSNTQTLNQVIPPGNARHLETPSVRPRPLELTLPSEKYLETSPFWRTSKYPPLDALFTTSEDTPPEMQAQSSSQAALSKFYSQQNYFTTPDLSTTLYRSFLPPLPMRCLVNNTGSSLVPATQASHYCPLHQEYRPGPATNIRSIRTPIIVPWSRN